MEQPIIVKYRWSADDLLQGYRYHWRQSWRPPFRIAFSAAIYIVAILCVAAGIVAYRNGDFSVGLIICPLLGLYWLLRPLVFRWKVRRQFAKRPDKDREIEWEIAPDKILVRSSLGHSEFCWERFTKCVQTPSGLMFYPVDQIFHFLPRRGFSSDADFEQVAELAKSKIQRFSHVA